MAKFIQIQKQIRDNATDVKNFVSELESWRSDITSKEKALLAHEIQLTKHREVPAPRSSSSSLTDASTTESGVSGTPSTSTASVVSKVIDGERQKRYNEEKHAGNLAFKELRYKDAIRCYSKCLDLFPGDAVALSNRAQAYLNCDMAAEAEADCDMALVAQPGNLKALYRRAVARKLQHRPLEALGDVEKVMWRDQHNAAALELRRELLQMQAAQREHERVAGIAAKVKSWAYQVSVVDTNHTGDDASQFSFSSSFSSNTTAAAAGEESLPRVRALSERAEWRSVPVTVVADGVDDDEEEEVDVESSSSIIEVTALDDDNATTTTAAAAAAATSAAAAAIPTTAAATASATTTTTISHDIVSADGRAAPEQFSKQLEAPPTPSKLTSDPSASAPTSSPSPSPSPLSSPKALSAAPVPAVRTSAALEVALRGLLAQTSSTSTSTSSVSPPDASLTKLGAYVMSFAAAPKTFSKLLNPILDTDILCGIAGGLDNVLDSSTTSSSTSISASPSSSSFTADAVAAMLSSIVSLQSAGLSIALASSDQVGQVSCVVKRLRTHPQLSTEARRTMETALKQLGKEFT